MSKAYNIPGQFAWRLIEMLESPAYRALSRAARQILDRIEIELAHHGGKDNGRLPVTFAQFVAYGIHRRAIAPAIRELVALGFIEVTRQGRAGNGEWRRSSLYRITYHNSFGTKATNEWRQITDTDLPAKVARQKKCDFPVGTLSAIPSGRKRTESRYGKRTSKRGNAQKTIGTESVPLSRLALHLVGLGSQGQQQPPSPPDPTNPEPHHRPPVAEPGDGLDIPEFLRRGSR
jgi:hypothetical protein